MLFRGAGGIIGPMKRFVSDIDRIMALIYEDQPLPPPVPKEAAPPPAPEPVFRKPYRPERNYGPGVQKSLARETYAMGRHLRKEAAEPTVRKTRSFTEQHRRAAKDPKPQLQLDFSALSKIRSDAEITRNRLLTDEEREEAVICGESGIGKEAELPEEPARLENQSGAEEPSEYGLDYMETEILLALLNGKNAAEVNTGGQLLSVLVDQINEKLFDVFADTVIENGMSPRILPDYEEELKAIYL